MVAQTSSLTVSPIPAPATTTTTTPPANTNTAGVSDNVAPLLTGFTPSDQAVMAQQQKAAQDLIDSIKQNRADRQAVYAKMDALKQPDPAQYPLQNYGTPPPNMPDVQPIKAMGNWAVALAMLGSLLTRRPLTAALKAGAAAMGSYTQARWHDYQIQRQVWQDSMDQAMRQNDLENQQYRRAYNLYAGDLDKLSKELDRIAGDNQDSISIYQVRAGLIEEHYKLLTHREDMQAQYQMRREMQLDREANRLATGHNVPVGEQIFQNWMEESKKATGHYPNAQQQADFARKNLMPSSVTGAANLAATSAQFDAAHNLIADAQKQLQTHPHIAGFVGEKLGQIQGALGQVIPSMAPVARRQFDATIAELKPIVTHLMKSRVGMSAVEEENANEMIQGTGNWDDPTSAQDSLSKLDHLLYTLQNLPFRYTSPEQVVAAYKSGEPGPDGKPLSWDDAAKILNEQFNVPLQ